MGIGCRGCDWISSVSQPKSDDWLWLLCDFEKNCQLGFEIAQLPIIALVPGVSSLDQNS